MPDPREWISRVKDVEPPELWDEATARASSISESDRAALPDGHPLSRATSPRRAALVTGVAAGILALAIVILAIRTGPAEKGENRATPTPEVSSLLETHKLLERLLSDLWTAEARLDELQGELEAAHNELRILQDALGPDPTEAQLREIDTYQGRIQGWTQSARESRAVVSTMRARVDRVRAARAQLIPPPVGGDYPDVATVTCDGDYTGGTHLSIPVVRMQPDGVHFRVVNRISNERVFLVIQPDGAWVIPPGETIEVVIPPRPAHDVELTCTFEYPRDSWVRPTHSLWIDGSAACPVPPFTLLRLPWLPEGAAVPAAEPIDESPDAGFVWFEDSEERFAGTYVALKRSPWSPFGRNLSEFPTAQVRGTTGHLVWVGDPGVGELALVWREAGSSCEWYTLSISGAGLSEVQAEQSIRTLAASLS
jgi:hypothetical protein